MSDEKQNIYTTLRIEKSTLKKIKVLAAIEELSPQELVDGIVVKFISDYPTVKITDGKIIADRELSNGP